MKMLLPGTELCRSVICEIAESAPEKGGSIGEGGTSLMVGRASERHYVMSALLNQHADDALQPVADEVAAHLHCLLLPGHQLRPATHCIVVNNGRI